MEQVIFYWLLLLISQLQPGPSGEADENDYNDVPAKGRAPNYISEEPQEEAYEDEYEEDYGEVRVQHKNNHYYGGKYWKGKKE